MLNANYILGLVDGEGSFTVYVRNPKDKKVVKRRVSAEPRFYIKVIERDKNILYELKEFFGCGNVYFQKDSRLNHQNCYRYEVANRADITKKIIPFFKKNHLMFDSKKRDFAIFCKLIDMMNDGYHLNRIGLKKMYGIKKKMHQRT